MCTIFKIPVSLIVVAGLVAACGSAPPGTSVAPTTTPDAPSALMTVISPSGRATLGIPEGALPAGFDPASIHIDEPEPTVDFSATGLLAVFDLQPDGTTFTKPLVLTLKLEGTQGIVPFVVLTSGDTGEMLESTSENDPETGQMLVTAEIGHFSTVVVHNSNIRAEITNPGDQVVDVPFSVSVTITRTAATVDHQPFDENRGTSTDRAIAKVHNAIFLAESTGALFLAPSSISTKGFEILVPGRVERIPPAEVAIEDVPFTFTQRFTCTRVDIVYVSYFAITRQNLKATLFWLTAEERGVPNFTSIRTLPFRCTAAVATATPKPPTPSPAPPSAGTDILAQMAGTYDITRTFDANDCGYGSYTGEGTFRTGEGGIPYGIYFGIENDAPNLSFMEYRGNGDVDGSFQGTENAANYYEAIIQGIFSGGTITYTESVTILEDGSPCKGETLTTTGTATKK